MPPAPPWPLAPRHRRFAGMTRYELPRPSPMPGQVGGTLPPGSFDRAALDRHWADDKASAHIGIRIAHLELDHAVLTLKVTSNWSTGTGSCTAGTSSRWPIRPSRMPRTPAASRPSPPARRSASSRPSSWAPPSWPRRGSGRFTGATESSTSRSAGKVTARSSRNTAAGLVRCPVVPEGAAQPAPDHPVSTSGSQQAATQSSSAHASACEDRVCP